MKRTLIIFASIISAAACTPQNGIPYGRSVTLDRETLQDKIKGGWAGQTIGCTYGGPTEFKHKGGIIHDEEPIIWYDDYALDTFNEDPGLYDDVYMDLTFMETMAREGIDAPAESYALAFANADYKLWHANQAARYNILHGIMPPASGHWLNNPHADDIDFQIEADFIGMITPGMVNRTSALADRIGHIMNYGDGFYGGVFIGAMYSLAFVCNDIETVVREALRTIPAESKFHRCIADVIALHRTNPDDWKQCWFEINKRYAFEKGCPEGVFNGFNIDATLNSAYVVIGLLYGEGDFGRTMDIATRCGQDSDCNPASAAGILGVMYGYKAIPDCWKPAMERCEHIDFPYTSISLAKVYDLNLRLLTDILESEGGKVEGDSCTFTVQEPQTVPYEESFAGIEPCERRVLKRVITDDMTVGFNGSGVVLMGAVRSLSLDGDDSYTAVLEVNIDGVPFERVEMPYDYIKRKYDIFHTYALTDGRHEMTVRWVNRNANYAIDAKEMVVYTNEKH